MAEIPVASTITKLALFSIKELYNYLKDEVTFLSQVEAGSNRLRDDLQWIQGFLKDVDGTYPGNERAAIWVSQIRDVAYDAEDNIDTIVFHSEEVIRIRKRAWREAIGSAVNAKDVRAIRDAGEQIIGIGARLKGIADNRIAFGIDDNPLGGRGRSRSRSNQSQPPRWACTAEGADVVRMEDEEKRLVSLLTDRNVKRRAVISITGMGGMGKTTIAKTVCDIEDVKRCFDVQVWVSVTQDYRVSELLLNAINDLQILPRGGDEHVKIQTVSDERKLRQQLSNCLKWKRYLVVLDDVWDREAWNDLEDAFPDVNNGSRVLLTTRNQQVALSADDQSEPHQMRFANETETWALFLKKAGKYQPLPDLSRLIRKTITAKCGGIPLAAEVLGDQLSEKRRRQQPPPITTNRWNDVLADTQWRLIDTSGLDQIKSSLALSYYDLPYHLKSCFLYLGAFQPDSPISAQELTQLWVAEGFVDGQERGPRKMEDVAEDYLNELIDRNMVQVRERKSNEAVQTCCIHKLFHALVISVAGSDNFLTADGNAEKMVSLTTTTAKAPRRLAIRRHHGGMIINISPSTTPLSNRLRSFLWFADQHQSLHPHPPTLSIARDGFQLLRVLDLRYVQLSRRLPNSIGSLIHLRYLSLKGAGDKITSLPQAISGLNNLQTLDLRQTHIKSLPEDISKMEQLRHLLVSGPELSSPNRAFQITQSMQIECLRNLQTVSIVKPGRWMEVQRLSSLSNLRDLHLEGDLMAYEEALVDSIFTMTCLRSLHLEVVAYRDQGVHSMHPQGVDHRRLQIPPFRSFARHTYLYRMVLVGCLREALEHITFPPNLKELFLRHSLLKPSVGWIFLKQLPELRSLTLDVDSYMGKELACYIEEFPQLDKLQVVGLSGLRWWRIHEGSMKKLRWLEIKQCSIMRSLPEGLEGITSLQELRLEGMSEAFKTTFRKDQSKFQHLRIITDF